MKNTLKSRISHTLLSNALMGAMTHNTTNIQNEMNPITQQENTMTLAAMSAIAAGDTALDLKMLTKRPTIDQVVFPRSQRKRRRNARRAHAAGIKGAFSR